MRIGEEMKMNLCLINDKKEYFPVTTETLKNKNLYATTPVVIRKLRWSEEGIMNFLNSNSSNPNEIFNASIIEQELRKYIEFPDDIEYKLVTAWIVGTYLIPVWKTYPYLSVSGTKRVGKSKLLSLLEMLCFNAINAASISTPSIFRLIEATKCTLLIDEAGKLSYESDWSQEMRNILQCGYKRGAAVVRTEEIKGQYIPKLHQVFSPKAFVTFKGAEEILEDRCINLTLLRTTNEKILDTEIDEEDPIWQKIRDMLYVFTLKKWKEIKEIYDNFPSLKEIKGRFRELWKPIFVLTKYLYGEETMFKMINYAKQKTELHSAADEETPDMLLLTALKNLVKTDDFYKISDIKKEIEKILPEDAQPKWLTTKWVGRSLTHQFKIDCSRKIGKNVERYITVKKIKELCNRYGITEKIESKTETELSEEKLIERLKILYNSNDTFETFLEKAIKALPDESVERIKYFSNRLFFKRPEAFLKE